MAGGMAGSGGAGGPEADPGREEKVRILLELYKEQCAHGRHTELQRHAVSAMFLAAAGIFISVIGTMRFAPSTAPLALCVVLLGLYARRFVREYEGKWDEAAVRRDHYRKQIEELTGVGGLSRDEVRARAREDRKKKVLTLRTYWRNTFIAVAAAGAICLLIVLTTWVLESDWIPGPR